MKASLPLRFLIPLSLATVAAVLTIIVVAHDVTLSYRNLEQSLLRESATLSHIIVPSLERALLEGDSDVAEDEVERLALEPHLSVAIVFDGGNRVIYTTDFNLRGRDLAKTSAASSKALITRARQTMTGQSEVGAGGDSVRSAFPFHLQGLPGELRPSRTAVLYTETDLTEPKREVLAHVARRSALMVGAALLACFLVWAYLRVTYTRYLDELVAGVAAYSSGSSELHVPTQANDEITQIGNALTRLFQDLSAEHAALRDSEQKFASVFRNAPVAITLTDLETGRVVEVNDEALRASGCTREELIGRTALEIGWLTPQDRETVIAAVRKKGRISGLELRVSAREDRTMDALFSGEIITVAGTPHLLSIAQDITELKDSERALRVSEQRWRAVVESDPECVILIDESRRLIEMNRAGLELLRVSLDQVRGIPVRDTVAPEHRESFDEAIDAVFRGEIRHLVYDVITPDGRRLTTDNSGVPLWDPLNPDRVKYVVGISRDITDEVAAEQAMHRRAAFDAIVAQVLVEFATCSAAHLDDRIRDTLERVSTFIGAEQAWVVLLDSDGQTFRLDYWWTADGVAAVRPEDFRTVPLSPRQWAVEKMRAGEIVAISTLDEMPAEAAEVRRQFELQGVRSQLNVPFRYGGTPFAGIVGFRTYTHEITWDAEGARQLRLVTEAMSAAIERRQSEAALNMSRQQLLASLENTPNVAVQWYDDQARILYWNPVSEMLYGWSSGEALGRTPDQLNRTPEETAAFRTVLSRVAGTRTPFGPYETRVRHRDGTPRWVLATTFALPMAEEQIGFVCMDVDITERKNAEAALAASEARYRALFEAANDAVFINVVTPEGPGRFIAVNSVATERLGYTHEEFATMTPADIDAGEFAETRNRVAQTIRDTGQATFETVHCAKDGRRIPVEVSSRLFSMGETRATLSIARDITERKLAEETHRRVEEQLRQAQKMEAVGQLAGGVAHDFNNLLSVISNYSELLLMDRDELPRSAEESVQGIVAAATRAADLTRQLLAFSRKQVMQARPLDLNGAVGNLTKMLTRIIGENIQLHCTYAKRSPHILADVGMIEQMVINLVVNARDAMPGGGDLTVITREVTIDEEGARKTPEARSGKFACLSVRDTGTGIAPEHIPHLFEPFFTTKEVGKGTGLGLATVYGIVQQHRGWIEVESKAGEGTAFHVFMPLLESAVAIPSADERPSLLPRGFERILLVEDDAPLRAVTRRLLESYGYKVEESVSGREALEIWAREDGRFDLLITDMVMPEGISGRELAERLCRSRPALRVIVMSGYSIEMAGGDAELLRRTNARFIQKPCPPAKLIETVRECLDESVVAR